MVEIKNYGDQGMQLAIMAEADYQKSFAGTGVAVYNLNTGEQIRQKSPYEGATYADGARSILYRLHFGDYGGPFLKIVYFILGMMGCLVIVRSEEHTSELQSLMRISYAVFCLKKKIHIRYKTIT